MTKTVRNSDNPIKTLGMHEVRLQLHPEVTSKVMWLPAGTVGGLRDQ